MDLNAGDCGPAKADGTAGAMRLHLPVGAKVASPAGTCSESFETLDVEEFAV
jgi:hypothetical protein